MAGDCTEQLRDAKRHHGAVADPLLMGRLGMQGRRQVKIGTIEFELRGLIAKEPDRLADGIVLGPRVLMSEEALKRTGLIQPGSLITWRYRVKIAGDPPLPRHARPSSGGQQEIPRCRLARAGPRQRGGRRRPFRRAPGLLHDARRP